MMKTVIVILALMTGGAALSAEVKPGGAKGPAKPQASGEAWKDPTPKEQYQSEFQRLQSQFSLENVASNRIEVGWDDIQGMATPLSYRVLVQPSHHPDMVFVLPDMAISTGDEGIGFAVGSPARLPDMWKITRKLRDGYLPMVESEWKTEGLVVSQTVFGILPRDNAVVTGKEVQYVVVRMSVANSSAVAKQAPLFLLVGKMGGSQNQCYAPYLAPVSRWRTAPLGLKLRGNALMKNDKVLLVFHSDEPVPATFYPTLDDQEAFSGTNKLTNGLRFDLQLQPRQTRTIDFVVAGISALYPASEQPEMQRVAAGFNAALERATAHWESKLEPAMKFVTPDARINDIYKAVILSNLGMLLQSPDKPWHTPIQTPIAGVWSWEFAHMAEPMIAIGYHKQLEPSLRYFTERQNGVGPQSANVGPSGNIKSTKGSYVGTVMFWMNETGAILWTMAEKYRYSRDLEWLKANKASILAAWDWVQGERSQTRIVEANGNKVRYYGLLPKGVPGDGGGSFYQFTFNDNFTWHGMSQIAKAFGSAGFPEADRLIREAEEYRQCILDVIKRERFVDPETKLSFIPNAVFYRDGGPIDIYWMADGPVQLFDTGLLSPNDPYFSAMVEYTKRKYGILMGMAEHVGGGVEWYPNQTERSYYKSYLARGEVEKALLVLYCNLLYGMSHDTYQTAERFHYDDANFSPLQPNASGNGRDINMLRRMVIDEQDDGKLWLLRGCPRRWFEPGQSILVEKAPTLFGTMAIRSKAGAQDITIDVNPPDRDIPEAMTLLIRCPKNRTIKSVTINGQAAAFSNESVLLPREKGPFHVVAKLD